jgi:hypothetical protein
MAFGNATFTDFGGAVSDIFASQGAKATASADMAKAEGDLLEQQEYTDASNLATQNVQFETMSTAISQAQQDRQMSNVLGKTRAEVAGAGFTEGGSALDILRSSASQGAIQHAVMGEQGLIKEAGYQEQAQSYTLMSQAAGVAATSEEAQADAANKAATGDLIAGSINAIAGVATLFTGGTLGTATSGFTPTAPTNPDQPLRINQYAPTSPPPTTGLPSLY